MNACAEIEHSDTRFFHGKQVIIEMTDGGADYCFECIGLAALMSEAFQSSRAVYLHAFTSVYLSCEDDFHFLTWLI